MTSTSTSNIRSWSRSLHALMTGMLLLPGCAGRMNVTEKMMWSTYPLATEKGAATAFVINCRAAHAPGGVLPVVFTSVHVLDTVGNGPLIIGLRKPDEQGDSQVRLLAYTPTKASGKERFYVRHPRHDVGAFALQLPQELAGEADMPSALAERMLPRDGKLLHSGMEVSFLGYPDVLPGTEGAFPVLRSGRVASYPVGTTQAHGRFLINSDVYPGDSGAPVFLAGPGRRPELVGMIIQRIGRNTDSFSHLAIAVDADVIRETLELVAAREQQPAAVEKAGARKSAN